VWSEEAAAPPVEREHARRTFGSRVITARRRVAAGRTRMTSRAPFATISLAGFGAPGEQPQWATTSQHAHAHMCVHTLHLLITGMPTRATPPFGCIQVVSLARTHRRRQQLAVPRMCRENR
jgi:hypothetical protein